MSNPHKLLQNKLHMHILKITVRKKTGKQWPVSVDYIEEPLTLWIHKGVGELELDENFIKELNAKAIEHKDDVYGEMIGKALFTGIVKKAFDYAYAASSENLHVKLVVESDSDLPKIDWEKLYAPIRPNDKWAPLALDQHVLFSLALPSSQPFILPDCPDLGALILVADPPDPNDFGLRPINATAMIDCVQNALGKKIARGVLSSKTVSYRILANIESPFVSNKATLGNLCAHLDEQRCTFLHIVSYGRIKDGESILFLFDPKNQVNCIKVSEFVKELHNRDKLPYLVFLLACESATSHNMYDSLAQQLVREVGIPAVVAMKGEISVGLPPKWMLSIHN